jgi:hypothetical protein
MGKKNWGMFFNSHHFWGKKVCWGFEMGLEWIHKQEFNMKLTYITKQKKQLMQIERKWCNIVSNDNLKLKLYIVHNLWEKIPLPFL